VADFLSSGPYPPFLLKVDFFFEAMALSAARELDFFQSRNRHLPRAPSSWLHGSSLFSSAASKNAASDFCDVNQVRLDDLHLLAGALVRMESPFFPSPCFLVPFAGQNVLEAPLSFFSISPALCRQSRGL